MRQQVDENVYVVPKAYVNMASIPRFRGCRLHNIPFKKTVIPHEIFANCRFSLLLDDIFASLRFICSLFEVK